MFLDKLSSAKMNVNVQNTTVKKCLCLWPWLLHVQMSRCLLAGSPCQLFTVIVCQRMCTWLPPSWQEISINAHIPTATWIRSAQVQCCHLLKLLSCRCGALHIFPYFSCLTIAQRHAAHMNWRL